MLIEFGVRHFRSEVGKPGEVEIFLNDMEEKIIGVERTFFFFKGSRESTAKLVITSLQLLLSYTWS